MARKQKIGYRILGAAIFILLEIAAFAMLKRSGQLQGIWIDKVSHRVMAMLWGGSESIAHYFSLGRENERLSEENFRLAEELRAYRRMEAMEKNSAFTDSLASVSEFSFIPASIVKLSRNKQHNYFILNKGSEDGISAQSGVITGNGIVGIIDAVDKHYSYGLSFMNSGVSISARLGDEGAIGPLVWDGISSDGAILKEIPLQYKFAPGDTVWTSGFSSIFPADIPLGVAGESRIVNGAVNEIKVKLFQSFSALRFVTIAVNNGRDEILFLESLEEGVVKDK